MFQPLQRPHAAQSSLWWPLGPADHRSCAPSASDLPRHHLDCGCAALLSSPVRLWRWKPGRALLQRKRGHLLEVADRRRLVRGLHSRANRIFPGLVRHRVGSSSQMLMNVFNHFDRNCNASGGETRCHRSRQLRKIQPWTHSSISDGFYAALFERRHYFVSWKVKHSYRGCKFVRKKYVKVLRRFVKTSLSVILLTSNLRPLAC